MPESSRRQELPKDVENLHKEVPKKSNPETSLTNEAGMKETRAIAEDFVVDFATRRDGWEEAFRVLPLFADEFQRNFDSAETRWNLENLTTQKEEFVSVLSLFNEKVEGIRTILTDSKNSMGLEKQKTQLMTVKKVVDELAEYALRLPQQADQLMELGFRPLKAQLAEINDHNYSYAVEETYAIANKLISPMYELNFDESINRLRVLFERLAKMVKEKN